jgi:hypothetical protein
MIDHPGLPESGRIDVHYHILPPRYLAVEQVHDAMKPCQGSGYAYVLDPWHRI